MSAWMPCFSKNWRVSSGYSLDTRTPCGRSVTSSYGESLRHGEHDAERLARRLRVLELAEDHDVAGRLLDPVAAGDAEVEEPLGHVGGDLLGAQDPHLVDARVVDGGLVVDGRRALDAEVGGLEQLEGGLLQRPLGQHEAQHGGEGRRCASPARKPDLAGGRLRRDEASAPRSPPRGAATSSVGRLGRLDASSRLSNGFTPRGSPWPAAPRASSCAAARGAVGHVEVDDGIACVGGAVGELVPVLLDVGDDQLRRALRSRRRPRSPALPGDGGDARGGRPPGRRRRCRTRTRAGRRSGPC